MRNTITLKDGTVLREGDTCLSLHPSRRRWYVVIIDGIVQGSGVERTNVVSCTTGECWISSRYQLLPRAAQLRR